MTTKPVARPVARSSFASATGGFVTASVRHPASVKMPRAQAAPSQR